MQVVKWILISIVAIIGLVVFAYVAIAVAGIGMVRKAVEEFNED